MARVRRHMAPTFVDRKELEPDSIFSEVERAKVERDFTTEGERLPQPRIARIVSWRSTHRPDCGVGKLSDAHRVVASLDP